MPDRLALFTYLSLFYELFVTKDPVGVPPSRPSKAEKEKGKDKKTPKKRSILTRCVSISLHPRLSFSLIHHTSIASVPGSYSASFTILA